MKPMKIRYDELSQEWDILEKEMVFDGMFMWVIKESGFPTRQEAQKRLNDFLDISEQI